MQDINKIKNMPKHIAIIMDGNGRWAKKRELTRSEGHKAGADAVRKIVGHCRSLSVSYLTLYAFSKENWKRPQSEVSFLFDLLVKFINNELAELQAKDIKLSIIGDISALPLASKTAIKYALNKTKNNKSMNLCLALNYSGRDEIVRACKQMMQDKIKIADINEESFKNYLFQPDIPEPDLIIRTSGELRLSNFMLYECAYSELYFTKVLFPDFDETELNKAIISYSQRKRKYGDIV